MRINTPQTDSIHHNRKSTNVIPYKVQKAATKQFVAASFYLVGTGVLDCPKIERTNGRPRTSAPTVSFFQKAKTAVIAHDGLYLFDAISYHNAEF